MKTLGMDSVDNFSWWEEWSIKCRCVPWQHTFQEGSRLISLKIKLKYKMLQTNCRPKFWIILAAKAAFSGPLTSQGAFAPWTTLPLIAPLTLPSSPFDHSTPHQPYPCPPESLTCIQSHFIPTKHISSLSLTNPIPTPDLSPPILRSLSTHQPSLSQNQNWMLIKNPGR